MSHLPFPTCASRSRIIVYTSVPYTIPPAHTRLASPPSHLFLALFLLALQYARRPWPTAHPLVTVSPISACPSALSNPHPDTELTSFGNSRTMGGFGTAREKQGDAWELGEGDPGAAAKTCGAPLLFFLPFGWFFVGGRVGDGEGSCGGRTVVLLVRGCVVTLCM